MKRQSEEKKQTKSSRDLNKNLIYHVLKDLDGKRISKFRTMKVDKHHVYNSFSNYDSVRIRFKWFGLFTITFIEIEVTLRKDGYLAWCPNSYMNLSEVYQHVLKNLAQQADPKYLGRIW